MAISALKRLGAREPIILEFRSSFALAGFAGSEMPSWVSQAQNKRYKGPSVLRVTIEGGNYLTTLTCVQEFTLLCFYYLAVFQNVLFKNATRPLAGCCFLDMRQGLCGAIF